MNQIKQKKKQIIGKLFMFILLFFIIVGFGILAFLTGPTPILYSDNSWDHVTPYTPPGYNISQYNGILDQHSHTLHSDGKLTVRQNIEWHISMGYNIIFITDHNTIDAKADIEELKTEYLAKGIVILLGMEWTTDRFHMNILGITKWDRPIISSNPSDEEIKAVIQEAHKQNAVCTINHILWSTEQVKMVNHPSRQEFLVWGIDFIEIVNDDSDYNYMYDKNSIPFCEKNNLGQITGTDVHRPDALTSGAVHGWTFINCSALTEEGVMEELRAHRTIISYDPAGYYDRGKYDLNPNYIYIMPLAELGKQCVALYENGQIIIGVIIYIVYTIGIFLIIEGYNIIRPKFWARIQKKKAQSENSN